MCGPKFCSNKISQALRNDAAAHNDAGASLVEAEAEMSERLRAGRGGGECEGVRTRITGYRRDLAITLASVETILGGPSAAA